MTQHSRIVTTTRKGIQPKLKKIQPKLKKKYSQKIERIHKRALKLMLNDFTSDYETLMAKANTSTLEVKRLRSICTEIYKTGNDLSAPYMKELLVPRNSTYALI